VLDLFEMTCGAADDELHAIGGVSFDIPEEFLPALDRLVNDDLPGRLDEYERLLVGNEILMMRARDVGVVTPEMAINASLSGPMLSLAGIAWDLRKADPYCGYEKFDFEIPVGSRGDCYDRFRVRFDKDRIPKPPG
jgi:NADH-quinone oxidoreductase subunit D